MLKVVLVIAIAVCFASAFKLRTEVTQEVCQADSTFNPSTPGPLSVDPNTGKPNSLYALEMNYYVYGVVSRCQNGNSSRNQGSTTIQTSVGTLILSDYGREQFLIYKPDPQKTHEWTFKTSFYHSMDGCGLVTMPGGVAVYFDTHGT